MKKRFLFFLTTLALAISVQSAAQGQDFYKDKVFFKSYIPYLSDVEKMGVYQQPLFEYANTSYAAQCYRDLWNEVKKVCL